MRRLLVLFALVGCTPPEPSPVPCPEGQRRSADAAFCEPIPPECVPGTAELSAGAGCSQVGWTVCPEGFVPAPSGWGCEPVMPVEPCPPGTMPSLGSTACTQVGWTHCGQGFAPDPSGWGCAAVLPPAPCSGSTFEVLGEPTCQALGDCTAAFPPPAASFFVDDSYSAAQVDATHFQTLGAALLAAPAGATIAVETGSYSERLVFPRAVTLVGRCAALVAITGQGSGPGLDVSGVKGVEVQGVSITGFDLGAYVDGAGSLSLRQCRLEGNFRTALQAMGAGTVASITSSVIRNTLPQSDGRFGEGVAAASGARLELTRTALVENAEMGLFATDSATTVNLSGVLIRGTKARANARYGWGLAVQGGAQVQAMGSAIQANRTAGVVVGQASRATLAQAMVWDTQAGIDSGGTPQAVNVMVMPGGTLEFSQGGLKNSAAQLLANSNANAIARVTLTEVVARSNLNAADAYGLRVEGGTALSATRTAVLDQYGGGLEVAGFSTVALSEVLVQGTLASVEPNTGYGIVLSQGSVTASRVVALRNTRAAVLLVNAGRGSFERSIFADTRSAPNASGAELGVGAMVNAQSELNLKDSLLRENVGAGLLAHGAGTSARVRGTLIQGTRLDATGDGQGVIAQSGAMVVLEQAGLFGNHTAGMQVADLGSLLKAINVVVQDTQPGILGNRGRGVNVQSGARLELLDSALVNNRQVGLFVWAAESRAVVTGSLVDATLPDPNGAFGNAAQVLEKARIDLRGSSLRHSAGIGLVAADASATVRDGKFEGNAVGLHVQDGSFVKEADPILEPVGSQEVQVTPSTLFIGNTSRLGVGVLPLPEL